MKNTTAYSLLTTFKAEEWSRFEKFLQSPYFNQREDVVQAFFLLKNAILEESIDDLKKEAVWKHLFPNQAYQNLQLNHILNYLSERIERFMASEEFFSENKTEKLYRCRAFRKRGLSKHFLKNIKQLQREKNTETHRHAQHWLFAYKVEQEVFNWQILHQRSGTNNLAEVTRSLANFFVLENLRWACTAQSLQSLSSTAPYVLPMTASVLDLVEKVEVVQSPATDLMRESYLVLKNQEDETVFENLKKHIQEHIHLFPKSESRDIFMAAINFCIRRHNRGQTNYTKKAFYLYKEALERGILIENGILPNYTYINISNLAHLSGEAEWALSFLEKYKPNLEISSQENIAAYALAGHYFRQSNYGRVLDLLQTVHFSEVFISLDVRKILLRSYFELGEWLALQSLLDSFQSYLRRQKKLGYHRESYMNLVRFTKRLTRVHQGTKKQKTSLIEKIRAAPALAERDWLLSKLI